MIIEKTKGRVNEEEALHVLRHRFGRGVRILSPLAGGETTQAYSFVAEDKLRVLRFAANSYGFYKDKFAHDHFNGPRRPIPRTIGMGPFSEGLFYSITEAVEGTKLTELDDAAFTEALQASFVDLVVFNRTDPLPDGKFGRWYEQGAAYQPTWQTHLASIDYKINARLADFHVKFSARDFQRIRERYAKLIEFCPNDRNLIHGDFGLGNVFTDGTRITGVIDWGNSAYGDAVYDIAWAAFWDNRIDYEGLYRKSIARLGLLEPRLEERLLCYKMHCALTSLFWYLSSGQAVHPLCNFAADRLMALAFGEQQPTGHFYQDLDQPHFDYDLQRVKGLNELYRGPSVDRAKPYVACVGAAQTFGRFCEEPFPTLLAKSLQHQVLNLGTGGAGPGLFDQEPFLKILNGAELVIVQVLSARSAGNSFFDNSRTGSLTGIRVSDGKEMRYEDFLSELMQQGELATVQQAVAETRETWVRQMTAFLDRIKVPKLLLWISTRPPDRTDGYSGPYALLGPFPQLVNREMVEALRPHCDAYVECVSQEGIPQPLWPSEQPIDGAELRNGMLVNTYYPSPEMHVRAAQLLLPQVKALLAREAPPPRPAPAPLFAGAKEAGYEPFLVVCAERTGSNLLLGLLNSHEEVLAGGELFNPTLIERKEIPWPLAPKEEAEALNVLRRADPVAFVERLFADAARQGRRRIGFKLMYGHGEKQQELLDQLAANRDLRVIHLKRRNLLSRYLSEQRAVATGVWAAASGAARPELPKLALDFKECVENFAYIESKQAETDALFAGHELLQLEYEDLAQDPQGVGQRVLAFLGMEPKADLAVRFAKTGGDALSEAIANYDELKAHFLRWADFFSE